MSPWAEVVDAVARRAAQAWGTGDVERQDVARARRARRRQRGRGHAVRVEIHQRKPSWLRAPARMGPDYIELKRTMRDLDLVTVCEEAGCPNIFDCWADGTATFMLNGDRCTRACGFCLVDTRRPLEHRSGRAGAGGRGGRAHGAAVRGAHRGGP